MKDKNEIKNEDDLNQDEENFIQEENDNLSSKGFNRRDKINFKHKFEQLRKNNNISLKQLEELMDYDDTNEEYIHYYLKTVSKKFNSLLNKKLMLFFPIISPSICSKFNLNKRISEKKRFHDLYNKIVESKLNSNELDDIISSEFLFPEELKSLKLSEEEKINYQNFDRWTIYFNKIIDFKKIDNEEHFYYTIMNYMIKNFKDPTINKNFYHQSLINFSDILNNLLDKTDNNKNQYTILFEYVILFILNAQENNSLSQINNIYLYDIFLDSISQEINSDKSLKEKEIIEEFSKYKNIIKIEGNDIIFFGNNNKIIKNFQDYYITKVFIKEASKMKYIKENFLLKYTKFDALINPKYYFSGLLYDIIEKYVSSTLSKSSIYECFNIKKGQCPELEEEIFTKKIHNHIRYLPYNSSNDTGRSMKQFCLIIIDPSKQKMLLSFANKIIRNIGL